MILDKCLNFDSCVDPLDDESSAAAALRGETQYYAAKDE